MKSKKKNQKTARGKEKVIRNRRPRETAPGHLKRLKLDDENELERKLRLEKVVARLAVQTEEERRARLENDAATKRFRLAMKMDEERKERLVKMVATTQLRLTLETEEKGERFWIEIGV